MGEYAGKHPEYQVFIKNELGDYDLCDITFDNRESARTYAREKDPTGEKTVVALTYPE